MPTTTSNPAGNLTEGDWQVLAGSVGHVCWHAGRDDDINIRVIVQYLSTLCADIALAEYEASLQDMTGLRAILWSDYQLLPNHAVTLDKGNTLGLQIGKLHHGDFPIFQDRSPTQNAVYIQLRGFLLAKELHVVVEVLGLHVWWTALRSPSPAIIQGDIIDAVLGNTIRLPEVLCQQFSSAGELTLVIQL